MYSYYVLRGAQEEFEGELSEDNLPGVDLDDGPTIIQHLVQKYHDEGTITEWQECNLTHSFFEREDNYLFFHGRWVRRSDTPWRRDRNN